MDQTWKNEMRQEINVFIGVNVGDEYVEIISNFSSADCGLNYLFKKIVHRSTFEFVFLLKCIRTTCET